MKSAREGSTGSGVRPWRLAVILDEAIPVEEQRCIRVGVLGVPNAGKSQLTNTLVGSKVSAVSPKTNTTRIETLGAVTRGSAQLVLLDLPGIVGPEHYRNSTHATKAGRGVPPVTCHTAFLFSVTRAVLRGPGRNPGASLYTRTPKHGTLLSAPQWGSTWCLPSGALLAPPSWPTCTWAV